MSKCFSKLLQVSALGAVSISVCAANVINFDDIDASSGSAIAISDGYAGLKWSGWYVVESDLTNFQPTNGYNFGLVSGLNVAKTLNTGTGSISSDTAFDLNSGYFTSAWRNGMDVTATAYSGTTAVGTRQFTIDASAPTLVNLNFLGVTRVDFQSSNGTVAGYGNSGLQIVIDNVTINAETVAAVPEPFTTTLMASAGILAYRRRRKNS